MESKIYKIEVDLMRRKRSFKAVKRVLMFAVMVAMNIPADLDRHSGAI